MDVGPGKVATFCRDVFGFKSKLYPSPSIALGASNVTMLEMAEGYSVFMLKGDRVRPHPIRRIFAPDGTVFYDAGAQRKSNALSRGVAEMIDEGLRAVVTGGTGRLAAGVPNARGKTGTTTSNKDAWFCGYTDGLVGIGWLGNLDRKPMARGVYGGRVTAGMWADVMTYARERFAPGDPGAKPLVDVDSRPADTLPIAAAAPDRSLDLTGEEAPILVSPPTPRETGPDPDDPLPEIIEDEDPAPVERAVEPAPRTAPEPPVRPRPSPPPADEEMVEVQICADTGKVATDYCPETVGERRARRQVPKSRCELHRP
jgi:penicillin-binding protein 1A